MDPLAQAGMRLASGVIGPIVGRFFRISEGPGAALANQPVRVSAYFSFKEKRRLTPQDFDRIARELVEAGLRAPGERPLPPGEEAGVAAALAATLSGLPGLELTDAQAVELGHEELARRLRDRAPYLGLSEQAGYFYTRLLDLTCLHVLHFFTQRSHFIAAALVQQSRRQSELIAKVDELVARIPRQDAGDEAFERRYLEYVVRKHSTLTIFGIDLTRTPGKWPLDAAYMSLEATAGPADADPADQWRLNVHTGEYELRVALSGPLPADQALADRERVLLRGEAGSGKTTLIQWLAVSAARPVPDERMMYVRDRIPFVLPLRTLARHTSLPSPRRFLASVGAPMAGEQPAGWEDRVLSQRRGLVLVDGIDEIPEADRVRAHEWLADLVGQYPGNRWLVTSRPSAVRDEWLRDQSFSELTLAPMSPSDVAAFIQRWHAAARTGEPEDDTELAGYESQLLASVRANGDLGRLATNPLMCGLICALHRDRRGFLPFGRKDLYAAALSMLLSRRDRERQLKVPEIREEAQLQLLQRLAYWLIRNGAAEMDRAQAEKLIEDALPSLPEVAALGDGRKVFQHFLLRSGLLRTPAPGRVDFIHRTFQDFLGARAALDEGGFGELARHADDDQWNDVIRMAVAQGRPRERTEIFQALLEHGTPRATLLALASLPQAAELDPRIRDAVQERAATLLPPRTAAMAKELGSVGPILLELLPDPDETDPDTAHLLVDAAAATGRVEAIDYLERFCNHASAQVRNHLVEAWPWFDAEEYAQRVISQLPSGPVTYQVSSDEQLDALGRHAPQTQLTVTGQVSSAGLARYGRRVRLESLNLRNAGLRDLGFLARQRNLKHLTCLSCPALGQLDALQDAALESLYINTPSPEWRRVLGSLAQLRRLSFSGSPADWDLKNLVHPAAPLDELWLYLNVGLSQGLRGLSWFQQIRVLSLYEAAAPASEEDWREIEALPQVYLLRLSPSALLKAPRTTSVPTVTTLAFNDSASITRSAVKRIPALFPSLTTLHLSTPVAAFPHAKLLPKGIRLTHNGA
ncbi:NACHT domain-containing protein [Streptomyces sp. NPDC101132]|uniref:NACHT domain-containing protein n=1 Tax=Streptomyces sp. NPDC101132 TaxID=3366110 RepID=UPI00382F0BA5